MNTSRRSRTDAEALSGLAARLTPRDYTLLDFLARHRIATAATIAAIFFTNRRRAALRIQTLTDLGLLTRSRVPGSGAYRYTLAWAGAAIHALRTGAMPPSRAEAAWGAQRLFHSAHRPHKEAVNGFIAHLHLDARARGGVRVTEWLNEAEASAEIIGARPDAAGTVAWDEGRILRFWFELDRDTEPISALAAKIARYKTGRLAGVLGDRVLLFGLPDVARLAALERACPATGDLTVAATVARGVPQTSDLYGGDNGLLSDDLWRVLGGTWTSLASLAR
ncbi:replication-relaxation family protein [Glycomyces sp. NPDC047010]|uniref:replication-relaxation family protein n=1 Tax=Glycomyces sp. NPDC047010 TaxID=3155023 RepID=UPI0033E8BE69